MKVLILENSFKPDGSKSPDILRRNECHDLPDEQGEMLIERGWAVNAKDARPPKEEPRAEEEPKNEAANDEAPKRGRKPKGE